MNATLIIVIIAAHCSMSLAAGDISTGVVRATTAGRGQTADSRIAYAFYSPSSSMPAYQRVINEAISVSVPFRMSDEEAPPSMSALSESYFLDVLQNFDKRYQQYITSADDINEAPWTMIDSTMINDNLSILGESIDIAQVTRFRYEFTGGAHGSSFTTVILVSKASGQKLNFEKDIIADLSGFTSVAETAFRKARKIPAKRSLRKAGYWFEQGFVLSENVQFSDDAITLIYNPYECAPYVMGEIRVSIPLKNVKHLLKMRSR